MGTSARRIAILLTSVTVAVTGAAVGVGMSYGADGGPQAPAAAADDRPRVTQPPGTVTDEPTPSPVPTSTPHLPERPAPPAPPAPPGGDVLLRPGDDGPEVRELQARLRQIEWFFGEVTDHYGDLTREAVAGFQAKRGFPATGVVDERTMTRLAEMTGEPTADELANVEPDPADGAPLDPRCLSGSVLCIDKSSSSLRWVVDGDPRLTLDARFGGNGYFTREGEFSVYRKSRDHVSSLYDTAMPFAMFFDGGQAVHYSPDFAANGYDGASHGCVNIRDHDEIAWLFDEVEIGDKVVVYWS